MPSQTGSFRFIVPAATVFAANPTDWITITPIGTRVVAITNISFWGSISGVNAQSTTIDILILRRSQLDSGGTFTPVAATPLEEVPPALSVNTQVLAYTANPTILGTLVGVGLDAIKLNLGTLGAAGFASVDFGTRGTPPPRLRNPAHQLAINLNGVTLPVGASISCRIESYEEQ